MKLMLLMVCIFQAAAALQKNAALQGATGTTPASTLLKTTG